MNTVSEVLGNSGEPITVTLTDGRVVTIRKFTQADKTAIEQHVKKAAREQLMEDRNVFSDIEFQLAYGAFNDRVASADYKFGGRVLNSFLQSPAGALYFTKILCSVDGKAFTEDELMGLVMDKPNWDAIQLAASQAMAESFPKGPARI